jgi:Cof subfamily protein (haloacid dehalogenase superfamily)
MSKSIVFLDIDGTLLNDDKELPESAKDAVHQLRQKGVHVAIATGRAPFMYKSLREQLGITSFISFNGQYVVHDDEVIYKNPLNRNILQQLESYASKNEHPMVFLDHMDMKSNHEDHNHIRMSMESLKFEHPAYDTTYANDREIYQALLFCQEHEIDMYKPSYKDLNFIRWHKYSTDVLPYGGSKAKGMEYLMNQLSINQENSFAFGDGLNDLEMLAYAGTGVAMGNAPHKVKSVANKVTKHVNEDGLHYGLKMVGLL